MFCIALKGTESEISRIIFNPQRIDITEYIESNKVIFSVKYEGCEELEYEISFRTEYPDISAEEHCRNIREKILKAIENNVPVTITVDPDGYAE